MKNREEKLMLVLLLIALLIINYSFINSFLIRNFSDFEYARIERVIDGDTVVVNGSSMRLLGINCPEKGEFLYEEAKDFLEELVLNKSLRIERHEKDLYGRELVYLFDEKKNINLEIIGEGFANYYFPEGKDRYYKKFVKVWEGCLKKNINLCEHSENICSECIELEEWNIKKQKVVLYNKCDFDCKMNKWNIKDEGRKKFIFENFVLGSRKEAEITSEDFNETYVWTSSGDTLFLRDDEGKLVLWEGY